MRISAHAPCISFSNRQFSAFGANVAVVVNVYLGPSAESGVTVRINGPGPYGRSVQIPSDQPNSLFYGPASHGRSCVICDGHLGRHSLFTTCGRCYQASIAASRTSHEQTVPPPVSVDLPPVLLPAGVAWAADGHNGQLEEAAPANADVPVERAA